MKRFFAFIMICLSICFTMGCSNSDQDSYDEEQGLSLEERAEMVTEGMTYGEIKALMGSDGVDIGSGVFLYEWVLSENKVLRVGMKKPKDQIQMDASNHDALIATRVSIEEKED